MSKETTHSERSAAGVVARERTRVDPDAIRVIAERAERIEDIDTAFRIEREVFEYSGYGQMPREFDQQSTFYLARSAETDEVLGCIRMIDGDPLAAPMAHLPVAGEWIERFASVAPGRVCEYGALAIPAAVQSDVGIAVSKALYRAGWRHTAEWGVELSGMIMEPRRARAMARWHGLVFEQAGPTTFYMGGDVATFVASPRDLLARLLELNPVFGSYVLDGFELDDLHIDR